MTDAETRVLVLALTARDARTASAILSQAGLHVEVCRNMETLCAEIEVGAGAVILSEESMRGGQAARLAQLVSAQPAWSDLPFIALSQGGLESPAALNATSALRNVIVLERPVRISTFVTAARTAVRDRARQYQTRTHLEQLQELDRRKDEFLAVVSHELRNPLAAVVAAVQFMERSATLSDDLRRPLEVMRRNLQFEARLIDDLLDLTRIVQGKLELDRKPIPISAVIERAVEVAKPDIAARRLHFGVDVQDDVGLVDGDSSRLQQVISNLLSNAVKFTPDGGCVGIRCRTDQRRVLIEVADSGRGIEAHTLHRIFEPFEQGERSVTRRFGGLGLGLTIAKRLVEMHEGTIWVTSQGRDKGTTVHVSLCSSSEQPATKAREAGPAGAQTGTRILLVEDNGDTLEMMKMLLEAFGYHVATAGDFGQALTAMESQRFDLLISDLGLPDRSGIELMHELRRRGNAVKSIALSGYGREEDVRRSREAGFNTHLTKPVDADRLVGVISGLL